MSKKGNKVTTYVTDETKRELQKIMKNQQRSESQVVNLIIEQSIKGCEHLCVPCDENSNEITVGNYNKPIFAKCIKCGKSTAKGDQL